MEHKVLSFSIVITALMILLLSLMRPSGVRAQYYAPGEEKKSVLIDKKIRSVNENVFFDNISASQKTFFESDVIEFRITVENVGREELNNINIIDTLPSHLSLIFFPGMFNKDRNTVEWTIDRLSVNESKDYLIRVKINSNDFKQVTQKINIAEAKVDDISDRDTASYFVGVKTIPKTGDPSLPLKTLLVVGSSLIGLGVRKFARGY